MQNIKFDRLFWILNVAGWLLFLGFDLFINFDYYWKFPDFWLFCCTGILGIFVSAFMRRIYQKYLSESSLLKNTIFLIIIVSILGSFARFLIYQTIALCSRITSDTFSEDLNDTLIYYFNNVNILKTTLFSTYPFLIWSLLYVGFKTWLNLVSEKEQKEKAFLLAQQSQLQMLRYQLNPHFLFNSLGSIQSLMYENRQIADKMLTELSEFLRYTLTQVNKTYVPFKDEMEAIQRYFSIEKIRYEEKLEYSIDCSPEAGNYQVLSFLIQPVIENAIKYGIKTSEIPLKIHISGKVANNILHIEISNSGHWLNSKKEGTGIANLKERLENAYPNRHAYKTYENDGRVIVELEIEHEEKSVEK